MLVLLGPQRFQPTLRPTLRSLGIDGPVAVVTAGWQERESEDRELQEHLDCEVVDLKLYHRGEEIRAGDPALGSALRERQEYLQEMQELYLLRLGHALEAARELMHRSGRGSPLLIEQRRAAIRAVRALDRRHARRIGEVHDAFDRRWSPSARPLVARHREQVSRILERTHALCVAGGHVSVLLNRMRLFDMEPLIAPRPVIAWSAGAMAVSERVVLFHDSPPQGAGNAEVLDVGLGLGRGLVALPHARSRLRLDDRVRVSLFARRFSPAICAVLDTGARLDWNGQAWQARPGTLALGSRGHLREAGAA